MKLNSITAIILCAILAVFVACKGKKEEAKVTASEPNLTSQENEVTSCPSLKDSTIQYVNIFFRVDTLNLVERSIDMTGTLPTTRQVDMGGKIGTATLRITEDLMPQFCCKGQIFDLIHSGAGEKFCQMSIKAVDLDRDGLKELLVHDGDRFNIYVYGIESGTPELKGTLGENFGFYITDDLTIIALVGSQGLGSIAHYNNGKLIVDED